MAQKTDEQLIEIVKINREDYQPEAIEAAEKALKSRKVNLDQVENIERELTEKRIKKNKIDKSVVSSATRLIHLVVDFIGFILTAMVLSFFVEFFISTTSQEVMELLGLTIILIAFFLYFMFMEYKYQKTIGKFLTKTKVVMKDGRKPELNEIFYRTACRLIPFDRISFLFTKNGFHDRLSNTTVIKDEKNNANIG